PEIRASTVVETESVHGSEPLAVLILRNEHHKPVEIINRANESLGQHQRVKRWFVWPAADFPRTSTQKIRKQVVAETVRAELAGAVPRVSTNPTDTFSEIIKRISKEQLSKFEPASKLGTDLK